MPQTKSAAKALRQTKKRTARNLGVKRNFDYLFRQFRKALTVKDKAKTEEISRQLIKALDKAAQKNVIKKNTAARKKSRLMKKTYGLCA